MMTHGPLNRCSNPHCAPCNPTAVLEPGAIIPTDSEFSFSLHSPKPVQRVYTIPEHCAKDVEMMTIWTNVLRDYMEELTEEQIEAASNWFSAHVKVLVADCRAE
jgi:hypothetical protein